jgi:hypothetical protein
MHLRYVEDKNQFVIPVVLPPDWSGTVEFQGFRSAARRHADFVTVNYTTDQKIFSDNRLEQLAFAAGDPELTYLLAEMQSARAAVWAIEETVGITRYSINEHGIFGVMQSAEAVFRIEGSDKFYGDVSTMMNSPFVVGCDGKNCWCYSRTDAGLQVASCPEGEVQERRVIIGDPFHASRVTAAAAIRHMNLEYLGTDTLDGRPCRVVQGWHGSDAGQQLTAYVVRWWIDSRTFLPLKVVQEWGSASRVVQTYEYKKINQSIPLTDFQPPTGKNIRTVPAAPLDERYNRRFLNVIDASAGRMSVQWGRRGPAGVEAQGLR